MPWPDAHKLYTYNSYVTNSALKSWRKLYNKLIYSSPSIRGRLFPSGSTSVAAFALSLSTYKKYNSTSYLTYIFNIELPPIPNNLGFTDFRSWFSHWLNWSRPLCRPSAEKFFRQHLHLLLSWNHKHHSQYFLNIKFRFMI